MKKITLLLIFLTASLSGFAQNTYYSEDFESGDLNGWVTNDLDGDGYDWLVLDASSLNAALGTGALMSFSWLPSTNTSLDPNNLVTSPAIDLTAATSEANMYLFFDQVFVSTSYPDTYSVYVTTSNDPTDILASTPLLTVTANSTSLVNKSINISSFLGQTVYVTFRHYDSFDKYYFALDNVVVKSVANNDAKLVSAKLNRYSAQNTDNTLTLTVKNVGLNAITNLTVNWNDGTDHISTISKNIAVGATSTTVVHPIKVNYSGVVEKNLNLTITAVNGNTDPVPANNTGTKKFNTISMDSPKKVLFEEGTGTWCGWCPRGAVAMAYMDTNFPNEFIGVAVHNGDPMTIAEYDDSAAFSGFPGMNVDRAVLGADVSQSTMTTNLNTRKQLKVPAALDATGDVQGSDVTINASVTFRTVFANANYRLGVIISEDNVTGTDVDYGQNNYYSGGANGVMGGYEALASPVPAADMVYNHVGRDLLGGYMGQDGSVPTTITDGQTVNYTFNYTVPSTSTIENMHAVLVLIDQDNGEVVNAKSVELATLAVNQHQVANAIVITPNPTSDFININNLQSGDYKITIYDMLGKVVQSNESKNVAENQTVTIPVKGLSKGEYIVNIASGKSSHSEHLLVK